MLQAGMPIQGVHMPLSQRSLSVRGVRDSRTGLRSPIQRSHGNAYSRHVDQDVKLRIPVKRLVSVNSSASASSGGFFDNKLPAGFEGAGSQGPKQEAAAEDQPIQEKPVQENVTPSKPPNRLQLLLTPLSDPVANSRLLALCFAQTLCSVATLIHDTYLPVYLQDVLGMSNQKVGNLETKILPVQ